MYLSRNRNGWQNDGQMNKYIRTSYFYLIFCIPFSILFSYFDEGNVKYCVWIIVYIALVTVSIYETEKERRRVRRILTNGKCIEGVIDRLQEIRRETIFNGTRHAEETVAYRIVVKVQGEYDSIRYFYSDEISRWKKNHISPRVKIYDDMEDIYIEYEKTKEKIHYEIEKTREVMKVQFARGFLGTMNALALIGLIGVLCFYLSLIGDIS